MQWNFYKIEHFRNDESYKLKETFIRRLHLGTYLQITFPFNKVVACPTSYRYSIFIRKVWKLRKVIPVQHPLRITLKLDVHEGSAPVHLERISPHRSNFQPIHLDGSLMEAPCQPHNWSLQSPRATVPTPPLAFQTRPLPRFPERASHPLPHFVVLSSVRHPFPR
ncbi:hypothetical protein AVEN_238717-1 [Araneus ventricosus]|uniref:Uncharacterized protein n=1 Tax=Araneus ventricosus TaxID=182803 RepID=A0A4Y2NH00_ARAVE|nr:hypothetical protein AVEN_238717-1 [Araneus ventricosus]